jgi:hypothetical protein
MFTELLNPIYATYKGMPVIIIGVKTVQGFDAMTFVFIEDDGTLREDALEHFIVDVRFKDGMWHDVSPGPEEPME